MKSLVIGGNGFIGTNLVDCLLGEGHKVRVFDRYPSRFREQLADVEYVYGDFANHGEVRDAVHGVDFVFHLAYTTLPHTSNEDPVYDIRSNVVDTVQLLQECRDNKVSKVIFVSSGGTVYGVPQKTPIEEDHPTEPICSYGITKLAIEKYLNLFHKLHGLEYVAARLSNPYGEQQNPNAKQGAVTVFLGNIAQQKPITIWGDGEVVRDYIYIGDAVSALLKAAQYQAGANDPRVFNVGAGGGHSLNQLIEIMRDVCDLPVEVKYTPGRPEDVPANVLDITQAKKWLQWEPKMQIHEGLSRTWSWLKTLDAVRSD
ncbi:MAG TPA: NAD-dependent epimerase/dehydratase family protein [Planktothrix sp.]|jgi:UDP-glucose 4-epimerase